LLADGTVRWQGNKHAPTDIESGQVALKNDAGGVVNFPKWG